VFGRDLPKVIIDEIWKMQFVIFSFVVWLLSVIYSTYRFMYLSVLEKSFHINLQESILSIS
jgi:hypothetical protein